VGEALDKLRQLSHEDLAVALRDVGRLLISYQAIAKNTSPNTGLVAIFIGSNQLAQPSGTGAPTAAVAAISTDTDFGWVTRPPRLLPG
jgi:hypothetical protein